jgi:DtxR family manganese transport transcriptional regulator
MVTTKRKTSLARSKPSRSKAFHATRRHHSDEAAEDYAELIADLIAERGVARTCDIAKHLGISHVTAIKTLRRLERDGYIKTESHRPVELTSLGDRVATRAKERHDLLVRFLVEIGVPQPIAEIDAEGAEHHMSDTTLEVIRRFLKNKE